MHRESLDITQELASRYKLVATDFDPGAFRFEVRTPAHTFTSIVAPIKGGEAFVTVTARDGFDESLARALLAFVRSQEAQLVSPKGVLLLEGFHHPGYGFDSVLAVPPDGHETFKNDSAAMHSKTWLILPIHRCEFSGTENGELIKMIRREFVSTLDWKRGPSPQVWMKYKNLRKKSSSRGQALGLAKLDVLLRELKDLPGSPGSFVEVKNFKGEQLKVTNEGNLLVIEGASLPVPVRVPTNSPVEPWIEIFAHKGFASIKEALPQ